VAAAALEPIAFQNRVKSTGQPPEVIMAEMTKQAYVLFILLLCFPKLN
jgi:hypothetical protein